MDSINYEIFTCDKSSYFNQETNKWNTKKVQDFWKEIRKYISLQEHEQVIEFNNFIFPAFEEEDGEEYEDENGLNFNYYDIDRNFFCILAQEKYMIQSLLSFENCTFLADLDFGSRHDYEYSSILFRECEFKEECEFLYDVKIKSLSFIDKNRTIQNKNISIKSNVEDFRFKVKKWCLNNHFFL